MTAVIELHAHSAASFDSSLSIEDLVTLAAEAGITHLALTDHDTIEGALAARRLAPQGLRVIIGQEVRTNMGDVIAVFISRPVPRGLSLEETSRLIREQGGLVGLPHGFDPYRPSVGVSLVRAEELAWLSRQVDYVEVHNGRVQEPRANERAAEFAQTHGLPGVAASDSHMTAEVGQATTRVDGEPNSAADLRAALLAGAHLSVRGGLPERPGSVGRLESGRLRLERLAGLLPRKK